RQRAFDLRWHAALALVAGGAIAAKSKETIDNARAFLQKGAGVSLIADVYEKTLLDCRCIRFGGNGAGG
ncbi:MAG: hypothetical protein ICV68_12710, partial [Pyrinomonadaceae bacterium]|nr:hypothetical protein [Pyrinomonadaceae bacterium]